MKLSNSDLKSILWSFGRVRDNASNYIENKKIVLPSKFNKAYRFIFNKKTYVVLIDSESKNIDEILTEIYKASNGVKGELLKSSNADNYEFLYKGKAVFLFVCNKEESKRLDVYLKDSQLPIRSRSYWQKMIKDGRISVNSKIILNPNFEVSDSKVVFVNKQIKSNTKIAIPIIYLDENVIVIDKPAGVLTHSKGIISDEFTVADFFRDYTNWGLDTNRPGIVHRLDRDTSGVLIGARNKETALTLQKQFADRQTKKVYLAVVNGVPKYDEADIDLPIKRSASKPNTFVVDASGKKAATHYKVLKTNGIRSLIELSPKTGRTHQLRVHMQYIGTPIYGDRFYSDNKKIDRLYLHAKSLEINIPLHGKKVFESSIPDNFFEMVK